MPPADGLAAPDSTRPPPRLLLLLAGLLLVARVATGVSEHRHPPRAPELMTWRPLEDAVGEARRTKKPILYDFTADWCPPCQAMQHELFADRASVEQLEGMFVPVRVLDRQREEGRNPPRVDSLQTRFRIDSFPTLVVEPPDGGEPVVVSGYPGRQETLQQLTQARMRSVLKEARFKVPR